MMRQEVIDLAQGLADAQLESLEYMIISEVEDDYDIELTDEERDWVFGAVTGARTTLDPVVSGQIERLRNTVRKLSNISGIDLSELMDAGYLTEDDLG